MLTLAQLIQERKGSHSYRVLAERGGLTLTAVHKYGTGGNAAMPPPETVRGLARALGVSHRVIVLSAAVGLGVLTPEECHGSKFGQQLPPEVDDLTPAAKKLVIDTARVLVDSELSWADREHLG